MERERELKQFKKEINLAEYAQSQGYVIDKKQSSRTSLVMRRDADKIIVATDKDGHGIYFSVRDDSDHGSIIDFAQHRLSLNMGQIRKELRPWITPSSTPYRPRLNGSCKPDGSRPQKPEPSTADRHHVLANWMAMKTCNGGHKYLEIERKLVKAILSDPRFINMVRADARGNAVFPHYDRQGLSGYELKNLGFTGFSSGGIKAIWHSSNITKSPKILVVESAIDAMSHAQISKEQTSSYISTGGSMSPLQVDLVQSALMKASERGAEIVLATDQDDAGDKLAAHITLLASPGARLSRLLPKFKDWNQDLAELERTRD